jgi:DNA replication ATP-dependent helicase Dna2
MSPSPRNQALADHFYRRIARISEQSEQDAAIRHDALRRLMQEQFERATEEDRLSFSTRYARISYVAHKLSLPRQLTYFERQFRKVSGEQVEESTIQLGLRVATELTSHLFEAPIPDHLEPRTPYPSYREPEVRGHYYQLRVLALEVDTERQWLRVSPEDRPEQKFIIPYGEDELADGPIPVAVDILEKVSGPFVVCNLINAQLREGGRLYPSQIVIEPDFLVNVTDVAACFGSGPNYQVWSTLPKRLLPFEKRPPLVRGSIVNSFLDFLVQEPDISFREIRSRIFALQPLELSLFNDAESRTLMSDLKHHFLTVQKFVRQHLTELNIEREKVILEPSFLSPSYGLQGRLDLLESQEDTEGGTTSIVELKTSKIFRPNVHGIRPDNFIQTVLYDLMINRALGKEAQVRSYILYSVDYDNPVRYAPPQFVHQMEALTARNQLVAVEMLIAQLGYSIRGEGDLKRQTDALFAKIQPERLPPLGSFTETDHRTTLSTYQQLSDLERRYLGAFMGFVAREQRLAKIGEQRTDHVNGLASLWLDERQEKIERFELLDGLTYRNYNPATNELILDREDGNEMLIKFRQGDIVALYGTEASATEPGDAIRSQILKSTIISIDEQGVHLRPRNPQLNDRVFRRKPYWAIEKDVLDSSFKNHYLGLYLWAASPPEFRQRWLGLRPPGRAEGYTGPVAQDLTEEQQRILRKLITAPDYFLLWGPPGTGKTSKMLHHLVRHLLLESQEQILLVAYTNRAVDEICESIERIEIDGEPFRDYLRIGSRLGAGEAHQDRLLQVRSEDIHRRKDLRELIDSSRVVVGTVASVGGKNELFKLKTFDRVIVDEASQILEPLLASLLSRVPRALLIGDHRQLPAVVQQADSLTQISDAALREAGVKNLATSLFERWFLTARRNGWDWAYDQLSRQGRMHERIMAFPALHFYQENLHILPESINRHLDQLAALSTNTPQGELQAELCRDRLVFLSTPADHETPDPKVNRHEAELMVHLIEGFIALYADTPSPILPGDIGIITPYRAQIAYIRQELARGGYEADDFSVDTVERYQGSAKRIILMSLCANDGSQLERLSQVSEEGVDRKLNVAMTRAREHLVLVGCPDVLRQSEVYAKLLDHIGSPVGV